MKHPLILSISIIVLTFSTSFGQQPLRVCEPDRNAPPASSYYWPPDTEVKVYLVHDMFTVEQQETLFAAMSDWSEKSSTVGAGVKFKYAGESAGLISCPGCLTVTRRAVHKHDKKHYAFFSPLKRDSAGLLISAWIDFDFATTDPHALRGFMAHELGHGMGLWDCKTCKKKQTIMNAFPGINKDNGLVQPSLCDLEVVKRVYQLERRVTNNRNVVTSGAGARD